MNTLKQKGYQWESLVRDRYEKNGYVVLGKNFAIRWGEIDLILENKEEIVFVEVKVVDGIEDWNAYLSQRKMQALERSIESYCANNLIAKAIRLDAVFVQNWKIVEVYENISNT